ncbi:dethiobiotin synthase [Paeniglutamicibacter sp. NPDC012692]|uniref:dethiobiotin synthase n=1 Tax=Paeniglutamicibacter sp. NPDC012692 TaxID=3364388 RepID=UPI0036B3D663
MIYVVTGTDTDVGKTVVTAALAAAALRRGDRVAVYKPTQTGVLPGQDGDAQNTARWLGGPDRLSVVEGIRLLEPMAPVDAALEEGGEAAADSLPTMADHVRRIRALAQGHDSVIVEGAGGLLVSLTRAGETVADLGAALDAHLVVVTRPDLGTLNHTALTLEAAVTRGFERGTLVLGSYPDAPSVLHVRNRGNLGALAAGRGWGWVDGLPAGLGATGPARGRNEDLWAAGGRLASVLV